MNYYEGIRAWAMQCCGFSEADAVHAHFRFNWQRADVGTAADIAQTVVVSMLGTNVQGSIAPAEPPGRSALPRRGRSPGRGCPGNFWALFVL